MPPAVLADSDDDGDDIAGLECGDEVSSSRGSRARVGVGARETLDGTIEGGAGSSENMRRQIHMAERSLLSNSASGINQQSSASPTKQAAKRRHTAAFASEGDDSLKKAVKRTKTTLKTYGGSKRHLELADESNFDHFREDDNAPRHISQSAQFSEHSGHNSSMPLPAGSLQACFLNHEPAVMFRDTGDTVADASSEQQRLIDQMMASRKGLSTSSAKEAQQASQQHSSSIPWPASDLADSAKSKKSHSEAAVDGKAEERCNDHADKDTAAADDQDSANGEAEQAESSQVRQVQEGEQTIRKPNSSPRVEIPVQQSKDFAEGGQGIENIQRSSKTQKQRTQDEDSEPLNSDDRAIGLPKERYVPRPSRRRTTQVIEGPIDYSVRPEKAAKNKRTKTTSVKTNVMTEMDELNPSQPFKSGVNPPGMSKDGQSGAARKMDAPSNKAVEDAADIDEDQRAPVKKRRTIKQDMADIPGLETCPKEAHACQSQPKVSQQEDDKISVKPAMPTPKPKSSSKAKRARTTIFEDHVEFLGSRRSPNLSQQQAKRLSALTDIQNEAAPKLQRKRKSVVAEASDDEDELAEANDDVAAKTASPPKRRRIRPSESGMQTQEKEEGSKLRESDDEENGTQTNAGGEQSETEGPPKKRGRGKPPKAASKSSAKAVDDTEIAEVHDKELNKTTDNGADMPLSSHPALTPSHPSAQAAEMPTPSPEKPKEQAKATPTPQKAASTAPAQHSPIKSSSKVPHRVGLSKRHRIPPLLRVMKPPKR